MMRKRTPGSLPFLRAAGTLALVLLSGSGRLTAAPGKTASIPTDEASIAHALNRVTFGPAPGDVERARAMGLAGYLELQLHPERLTDAAVRERLASMTTLSLLSSEIAAQYYVPFVQARRELQRRAGRPNEASETGRSQTPGTMPADSPSSDMRERSDTGAAERRFANLSPEERRHALSLRREQQKVLGELSEQKILRAVYSERQLEEVLVDFWFNHFNVFAGKGPVRIYLTEYERDAIRPHVLGSFRELLGAVAQSPAMLFYLDNWQSADPELAQRMDRLVDERAKRPNARPNAARRGGAAAAGRFRNLSAEEREQAMAQLRQQMPRGLNENYARELLELHTLGVDGGYTQQDVVEVARAFTGWTIRQPRAGGGFWFDD